MGQHSKTFIAPWDIRVDVKRRRAFVSMRASNQVVLFRLPEEQIERVFATGKWPAKVDVDMKRNKLFVPLVGEQGVEVLSLSTGKREHFIHTGYSPLEVLVDEKRDTAYISVYNPRRILAVDIASYKIKSKWPVNGEPGPMVYDGKSRLYMTTTQQDTLVVLDVPSGKLQVKPLNWKPYSAVLSPDGKLLCYALREAHSVSCVSAKTLLPVFDALAGVSPSALAFSGSGELYVGSYDSEKISVLSVKQRRKIRELVSAKTADMDYFPPANLFVLSHQENNVVSFLQKDVERNAMLSSSIISIMPSANEEELFVVDAGGKILHVYDTHSFLEKESFPLPLSPHRVALSENPLSLWMSRTQSNEIVHLFGEKLVQKEVFLLDEPVKGMDVTQDGKTLFAVGANQRKIYRLVQGSGKAQAYFEGTLLEDVCVEGEAGRMFAFDNHEQKLFIFSLASGKLETTLSTGTTFHNLQCFNKQHLVFARVQTGYWYKAYDSKSLMEISSGSMNYSDDVVVDPAGGWIISMWMNRYIRSDAVPESTFYFYQWMRNGRFSSPRLSGSLTVTPDVNAYAYLAQRKWLVTSPRLENVLEVYQCEQGFHFYSFVRNITEMARTLLRYFLGV